MNYSLHEHPPKKQVRFSETRPLSTCKPAHTHHKHTQKFQNNALQCILKSDRVWVCNDSHASKDISYNFISFAFRYICTSVNLMKTQFNCEIHYSQVPWKYSMKNTQNSSHTQVLEIWVCNNSPCRQIPVQFLRSLAPSHERFLNTNPCTHTSLNAKRKRSFRATKRGERTVCVLSLQWMELTASAALFYR